MRIYCFSISSYCFSIIILKNLNFSVTYFHRCALQRAEISTKHTARRHSKAWIARLDVVVCIAIREVVLPQSNQIKPVDLPRRYGCEKYLWPLAVVCPPRPSSLQSQDRTIGQRLLQRVCCSTHWHASRRAFHGLLRARCGARHETHRSHARLPGTGRQG